MRPQRSIVRSTRRLRSLLDWFEPVTPMPSISLARASPLPEEERTATLKPSWANLRAAAAPMPLPPAVTTATFSTIVLSSRLFGAACHSSPASAELTRGALLRPRVQTETLLTKDRGCPIGPPDYRGIG